MKRLPMIIAAIYAVIFLLIMPDNYSLGVNIFIYFLWAITTLVIFFGVGEMVKKK